MTTELLERPATTLLERPATTGCPDWRLRLSEAEKRGYFTIDDKRAVRKFHSCAVGERYGYPKELSIGDVPMPLRHYGMALVSAVSNNRFDVCRELLDEIEGCDLRWDVN